MADFYISLVYGHSCCIQTESPVFDINSLAI